VLFGPLSSTICRRSAGERGLRAVEARLDGGEVDFAAHEPGADVGDGVGDFAGGDGRLEVDGRLGPGVLLFHLLAIDGHAEAPEEEFGK